MELIEIGFGQLIPLLLGVCGFYAAGVLGVLAVQGDGKTAGWLAASCPPKGKYGARGALLGVPLGCLKLVDMCSLKNGSVYSFSEE